MTTQPNYDFHSLAITNIGCDEARKIMDFFIHMLDRKINFRISTQKNVMLLADLIYREPLPMVNYINGMGAAQKDRPARRRHEEKPLSVRVERRILS